jgi:hypothetical protein
MKYSLDVQVMFCYLFEIFVRIYLKNYIRKKLLLILQNFI